MPMRVLVVRVGAMGDVLHALPAVAALRRARPTWEIGWAVDRRWMPLLEGDGRRPGANRLHVVPTKDWAARPVSLRTLEQIRSLRAELRAARYDMCVDMQGTIRSAVIGWMALTRQLVGYRDPREAAAGWLYGRRMDRRGRHVVEQGCALLCDALGVELVPGAVELPVNGEAERWCDELLRGLGPICVLAPTAGWGAKMWPAERYGRVARELTDRGYTVLVNESGAHDVVADGVVEASGGAAVTVRSSVAEMVALLRRASLVIAGDTGPLHLAAALERPVLGLFGPTDPARNGPYGTRARVLRDPGSVTNHSRTKAADAGLLRIEVEDVVRAAMELLQADGMDAVGGGSVR